MRADTFLLQTLWCKSGEVLSVLRPWFHLFEFKPKNSDTTYGLGWLPLGGYCKISGMIDESFDTEQMKQPEQPYEFAANRHGSARSS